MYKLLSPLIIFALVLTGCTLNQPIDQLSVGVFNGVEVSFPVRSLDEINGSDIELYSNGKNIGLINRVQVPVQEQPAIEAVKNGFQSAKNGNQPPYELSVRSGLYGFAVEYKGMTTIHLASESEAEYMVTMSVQTAEVETLIESLR